MSLLLLFPSGEAPPVVGTRLFCAAGPEWFAGGAVRSRLAAGGAELSAARAGGADAVRLVRGEARE